MGWWWHWGKSSTRRYRDSVGVNKLNRRSFTKGFALLFSSASVLLAPRAIKAQTSPVRYLARVSAGADSASLFLETGLSGVTATVPESGMCRLSHVAFESATKYCFPSFVEQLGGETILFASDGSGFFDIYCKDSAGQPLWNFEIQVLIEVYPAE